MVPCVGSAHAGKSSHPPERATIFGCKSFASASRHGASGGWHRYHLPKRSQCVERRRISAGCCRRSPARNLEPVTLSP